MSQPNLQVQRTDFEVPAETAGWQKMWLVIGVVGALACVAGYVMQPEQFLRGYLIGFMLWLGLSLGCMALLMVQHLSGGLWGLSIRRILEASSKGLPLMAVLFLPLAFGPQPLVRVDDERNSNRTQRLVPKHAVLVGAVGPVLCDLVGDRVCFEQAFSTAR